jgi:2-dehydropantoate 2-reductase
MKVCVFGAGAVGSHLAARISAAKTAEVSVIARGPALEAIRRQGILLKSGSEEIRGKPAAVTDDPSSLPKQDVVIVTLKAHTIPALAGQIEKLLATEGCAVFMLNGLTWWWNQGRPGSQGALPLLDPEGALWSKLRDKALGCVVLSPNEIVSPGVVLHKGGNRYLIGEPSDEKTRRVQSVVDLFCKSGLPAEIPSDLRLELWRKLMGNASGNSLAALTRLGHYEISTEPGVKRLGMDIMRETLEVAAALGWDLRKDIDVEQMASRASPGPGPAPSMLQDVLLGRPLEVEAHLGQTQAFAREKGVATPTIDVVLPLLRGLDRSQRALAK